MKSDAFYIYFSYSASQYIQAVKWALSCLSYWSEKSNPKFNQGHEYLLAGNRLLNFLFLFLVGRVSLQLYMVIFVLLNYMEFK